MTVATILSRKGKSIIAVAPGTSVLEALQIMDDKNIGSVVVMENEVYLGIMTERDYSRKIALKGKSSTETSVKEIMSTDLPSVTSQDTIDHCMQLMTDRNIRYMPVIENGKLTGVISMSDVVRQTILNQKETIEHLESYIQQ